METATLPPNTIVPEVLEKDNYERWSILIKHYLEAQDVWDVVEPSPITEETNERVWIKKNALALHAIKISCGAKAFDLIKKTQSAKDAWEALLDMPKLPVYHDIANRHEFVCSDIAEPHQREQQRVLRELICKGRKRKVEQFFYDTQNARSDQGILLKSALHVAITAGQEDIARFLYRETPRESLHGDYGFILLEECITKKMFEIAFDLVNYFSELATNEPHQDYMPDILTRGVLTLAKTPAPFFGGSQLKFFRWGIYRCIVVNVDLIKPGGVAADDASGEEHSCYQCGIPFPGLNTYLLHILSFPVAPIPTIAVILLPKVLELLVVLLRKLVTTLSKILAKPTYDLKKTDVYAGEVVSFLCRQLRNLDHHQFVQNRAVEAIFRAIKNGIPEIATEIAKANEYTLWTSTDPEDSRTMFADAIAYRQEEVAKFLYGCKADKFYDDDEDGNNNLHLAAKLAPPFQLNRISGAALQLQSELRWFKSVEAIVPRFFSEQKNKDGETPSQVFVREHKNLLKEAEGWMKKTAESSTVVGALIITIMFAAAFTVPGGNDENTGFPIFLNTMAPAESFTVTPFKVFIVSDAISLFTASSSVLIFLGILTSRYAYEDFRMSLPMKLIFGLFSLFVSIATLTVAFCATVYVMLQGQRKEVIPITVLAGIPIMCFVLLQFPLLVEIIVLTLRPDIFDRKTATAQLVELLAGNIPIVPSLVNLVVAGLISLIRLLVRSRNG